MSNPTLLSLALSNGYGETDADIRAALSADGISAVDVEFEVSSLDAIRDRREAAGILGLAVTSDGRTVESSRWTAAELKRRNLHRLAGNAAESLAACFDTPERFEAMRLATEVVR